MKILSLKWICATGLFQGLYAGDLIGNPGELNKIRFKYYGHEVVKVVSANPGHFPEFYSKELEEAIRDTSLEFTMETLKLKGKTVDAINYPDQKHIKISDEAWNSLRYTEEEKVVLVFHEYLGIMRVDDPGYRVSSRILSFFHLIHRDQTKKLFCKAVCNIMSGNERRSGAQRFVYTFTSNRSSGFLELSRACEKFHDTWKKTNQYTLPQYYSALFEDLIVSNVNAKKDDFLTPGKLYCDSAP